MTGRALAHTWWTAALVGLVVGCVIEPNPSPFESGATATDRKHADAIGADAPSPEPSADAAAADTLGADGLADSAPPPPPSAEDYCELTADLFCPFYLRCGRMVAPDLDACRVTFLQACNARFEPIYVELQTRGLLALSEEGLTACEAHLATVACEDQIFDLDGPCGEVWVGQGGAGAACGPGIESFVCAPTTTCTLGLDFCGTCEPAAATGESCAGDERCYPTDICLEGVCTRRLESLAPCDGSPLPCRLGASCVGGVCTPRAVADVGEQCGAGVTCRYKSVCAADTCVELPLQGEPCAPTLGCASGHCPSDGACAPYTPTGGPCASSEQCLGACAAEACVITTSCLE